MAIEYNADGSIKSGSSDLTGILEAVLGKQVATDTNSTQNTTAASNQANTTTGSSTGTQNTAATGSTSQNTAGSQQNTSSQNTSGSTLNTGSQTTTGTVGTTTNTDSRTNQNQKTSADIGRLQEVYGKQAAGITPDMLAAIFQQGSKAAPNLVAAQAGALGARSVGNTPMARVLNQLNGDMTSKAADINRQMLTDSGNTAAQIADFTRNVNTSGSNSSTSVATQVQNLLTQNDSRSIVKQLLDSINNTQSNQNTTGTSANNQNISTAGTTAGTSNTAGTQTQNVSAAEQKMAATTINKAMTGDLLKMAAAGVGLDALLKVATGKGFVGNLQSLAGILQGAGAAVDLTSGLVTAPYDWDWASSGLSDPSAGSLSDGITAGGSWGGNYGGGYDFGTEWFADGGEVGFLPTTPLIKKQAVIGNPDADIESMLTSLSGASPKAANGAASGAASSPAVSSGPAADAPNGGGGIGDGYTGPSAPDNPGQIGHQNTGITNAQIGMVSKALGVFGVPLAGIIGLGLQGLNSAVNSTATEGVSAVSSPVTQGVAVGVDLGPLAGWMDAGSDHLSGGGSSYGGGPASGADYDGSEYGAISSPVSTSTAVGTDLGFLGGYSSGLGGLGGGGPGDASGGYMADGGEVSEESITHEDTESATSDDDEMMSAIGITRGTEPGSLVFNTQAIKMMHHVITRPQKAPGSPQKLANGGAIKGAGTGTSDSIPATGPGGRQLRVANGEYILPADVTQKFGVDALDAFVAKHHVPADLQRAAMGE